MTRHVGLPWKPEVGTIESSAGTEFSRQQTDEGELGPLPEAKRLKELLFRVLERERNGVYGGNWQGAPLVKKLLSSKVLRTAAEIKSIRRKAVGPFGLRTSPVKQEILHFA